MLLRSIFIGFVLFASTACMTKSKSKITPVHSSNKIVIEAQKYLGKPYKYGAVGPKSFDCSGFVYAVYKKFAIIIPRTSLNQSKIRGPKLLRRDLKVGDILFFDTSSRGHVNHSGIYLGNSKFIHASSGKAYSVTISDLNGWYRDKFKWGKHINENK